MSIRDRALESAKELKVKHNSLAAYIRELILAGFFDSPAQSKDIIRVVKERFGRRFPISYVQTYIKPFLEVGILRGRELPHRKGNLWHGVWLSDTHFSVRGAAERLRLSVDTTGWEAEVAEDFQLALACYSGELWKPASVMMRRAYEGALALKFVASEKFEPEKEGTCPKCGGKFGKRPMSITDLHYWAVGKGLVREKMEGLSILLKDLGAGAAHPTKTRVIDPDTAEIIVKCGAVLLRDLYSRKAKKGRTLKTPVGAVSPPLTELRGIAKGLQWKEENRDHTERF